MSSTPVAPQLGPAMRPVRPVRPVRRVRHQARDVVVLMAFSAGTSVAITALMVLLTHVGR